MSLSRWLNTLLLPVVLWLLLGAPSLSASGNLLLVLIATLHLLAVIWVGPLFTALQGDEFTYGMVTLASNLASLVTTYVVALVLLLSHDGHLATAAEIPAIAWGLMLLGVLGTVGIPLLSTRHVRPLPRPADVREYRNPAEDQLPEQD